MVLDFESSTKDKGIRKIYYYNTENPITEYFHFILFTVATTHRTEKSGGIEFTNGARKQRKHKFTWCTQEIQTRENGKIIFIYHAVWV